MIPTRDGVEKDKLGRKSLSLILGIQICMSIVDWLANMVYKIVFNDNTMS